MDKHSFPNGKRLVRDTLKPDDNLHYEKFSDGTVKCIEDEIPFDVPDGWAWTRIQNIAQFQGGFAYKSSKYVEKSNNIIIRIGNVKNNELNPQIATKYISNEYASETSSYKIRSNDILFTMTGTRGKRDYFYSCLVSLKELKDTCLYLNQRVGCLRIFDIDYIFPKFFLIALQSRFVLDAIFKTETGNVSQGNIGSTATLNLLVPILPVNEQKRIIGKINLLFALVKNIEKNKLSLIDDVSSAKTKIIDLAIRGKLVPQDQNDEPASILLERIRAEKEELIKQGKIKRDKKESVIFKGDDNSYYEKIGNDIICIDDEIPFETPINWQWVRLGSTVGIERGGSPRPIKSYITTDSNGINWIKIGDVDKDGKYITNTKEKIKPTGIKKSREVYPGDFLLTNSMSFGRPYISKIYGCVHDGWLVLRNPDVVFDINFLYYLLSSNYLYNQFVIKASGSTVDNLNIDKVSSALICLPPLKEQTMIVTQIEKIIRLIQPFEELL